jgi:hypothetical protein
MRWWAAVGLVLVLGGCDAAPAAPPSLADPLAGVHWADQVRDCSAANGGSGLGTVVDSVDKGDLTGDGRMDTLVVDECKASTSRWPSVVEVFDGASDPSRPTRLGTLMAGDPDAIRDATVSVEPGGRVVVTGAGLSRTAPLCCPDLAVRKVFSYTNGTFTLAETTSSPHPTRS